MSGKKKDKSIHYSADNRGGYGNPPVKGQFKTGGKGGPGRLPKAVSMEAKLRAMFKVEGSDADRWRDCRDFDGRRPHPEGAEGNADRPAKGCRDMAKAL